MKNLFFGVFTIIAFASCNQKEIVQSENENDSLGMVVSEKEETIEQFINAFNEIEINLDSVAALQLNLYLNTDKPNEFIPNKKENINKKIKAINKIMDSNRLKLVELSGLLDKSNFKNKALIKTIETLNKQLTQKDIELDALNKKLENLNIEVAVLNIMLNNTSKVSRNKDDIISKDIEIMHTAYYLIGYKSALLDAKIIDRKGGLLGIGRTSKLNADFDNSMFNKIDYTKSTTIYINSRCKIITIHPSSSYIMETDSKDKKIIEKITILNPEKFWSASKYLVVEKE